ncbi:hypothetical protein [Sphingomonas sp.]|nr:hypothetical protein [Sphingomonas sp.]
MAEPLVRPEVEDGSKGEPHRADPEWITPEVIRLELETAQQTI